MDLKRIAMAGATITGTLALVAGVTFAVFTATAEIPGNPVGTADVELSIDTDDVVGPSKPITASNLVPGQQTAEEGGGVVNTGTVPVKVSMYVRYDSNPNGVCNWINLTNVRRFGFGGFNVPLPTFNGPLSNLKGPSNAKEVIASLPTNHQVRVYQTAQLDVNAPNSVQASTCEWTEVFVA